MLLNELRADGNNFMQKNFDPFPRLSQRGKHKEINRRKKSTNKSEQRRSGESTGETGLHERAPRFLVSYA
jgi:hypothetical protein